MATIPAPAPPVNGQALDPWTSPPRYDVPMEALAFGVRVRHRVIPGVWKIVRGPERMDTTSRYAIRVREQAANGSLVGPVLSWSLGEVASVVTPEPEAEPAAAEAPAPAPPAGPAPLDAGAVLRIGEADYHVSPLPLAPDAARAFRLAKARGGDAYDLEQTASGVTCNCPDFTWRRDGLDPSGCKHIKAARASGLLPATVPAPGPAPAPEDAPEADDDDWQDEYRWAIGPGPDPADESGTARESYDAYNDRRSAEADGICHEGYDPDPLGWDGRDDARWLAKPAGLTMAEMVDREALEYRGWNSDLGDLLAGRLEALAAEMRSLEAKTPGQFLDRLACMQDARLANV